MITHPHQVCWGRGTSGTGDVFSNVHAQTLDANETAFAQPMGVQDCDLIFGTDPPSREIATVPRGGGGRQ